VPKEHIYMKGRTAINIKTVGWLLDSKVISISLFSIQRSLLVTTDRGINDNSTTAKQRKNKPNKTKESFKTSHTGSEVCDEMCGYNKAIFRKDLTLWQSTTADIWQKKIIKSTATEDVQ
jgi:hypothetical protein